MQLSFTIENTGAGACSLNAGTSVQEYEIRAGDQVVYRWSDCAADVQDNVVQLQPDEPQSTVPVEWDRTASSIETCTAERPQVPAGGALAVDRNGFSAAVSQALENHPRITIDRAEVAGLPPAVALQQRGQQPVGGLEGLVPGRGLQVPARTAHERAAEAVGVLVQLGQARALGAQVAVGDDVGGVPADLLGRARVVELDLEPARGLAQRAGPVGHGAHAGVPRRSLGAGMPTSALSSRANANTS